MVIFNDEFLENMQKYMVYLAVKSKLQNTYSDEFKLLGEAGNEKDLYDFLVRELQK